MFNVIYSALYQDFANMGPLGHKCQVVNKPSDLKEKNALLILHGGADISPSLYGARVSSYTGADDRPSHRDELEVALFNAAVSSNISILGICRGAQLACALNGGELVQHVTNHAGGNHHIRLFDGRIISTNSVHHQMMYPFKTNHKMLGWSSEPLSSVYFDGNDEMMDVEVEPEIVFFPDTKTLAVQGHPEWLSSESNLVKFIHDFWRNDGKLC